MGVNSGMPFFTFLLYGSNQGDTAKAARRVLTDTGGWEVGYFSARGEDFFYGYLKMGYLFSSDHPSAEELRLAEEFGAQVAARAFRGSGKYAAAPALHLARCTALKGFFPTAGWYGGSGMDGPEEPAPGRLLRDARLRLPACPKDVGYQWSRLWTATQFVHLQVAHRAP